MMMMMPSLLPDYAHEALGVFFAPSRDPAPPSLERTVEMIVSLFGDINRGLPEAEEAQKIRNVLLFLLEGNGLDNRRARCTAALELLLVRKLNLPA